MSVRRSLGNCEIVSLPLGLGLCFAPSKRLRYSHFSTFWISLFYLLLRWLSAFARWSRLTSPPKRRFCRRGRLLLAFDCKGNDVTEEDCSSNSNGKGGRSRCTELANNNQGCDTPSLGLDNEPAQADARFADLLFLGGYRPQHSSNSNLNLEDPRLDQNQDYRETQSPRPRPRGPLFF